jgi:hypothetical protein
MVGGSVLFGLGYAAAFFTGTMMLGLGACNNSSSYSYDSSYNYNPAAKTQCQAANGMLLVPVVGPVIGGLITPSVYWTVPWLFVDAAAQIGGVAMMIMAAKSNSALGKKGPLTALQVLPKLSPSSAGVTLAGRF